MQALDPLAILDVALASRHVPDMPRVHQIHLQTPRLQNFEHRHPIHAGRFHCHGAHPAGDQPIGQRMQVGRECGKTAHRRIGSVGGHTRPNLTGSNVQTGGIRANQGPFHCLIPAFLFSRHRCHSLACPDPVKSVISSCSSGSTRWSVLPPGSASCLTGTILRDGLVRTSALSVLACRAWAGNRTPIAATPFLPAGTRRAP